MPTAGTGAQTCPHAWHIPSTTLQLSLSTLRLSSISAAEMLAEFLQGGDFSAVCRFRAVFVYGDVHRDM